MGWHCRLAARLLPEDLLGAGVVYRYVPALLPAFSCHLIHLLHCPSPSPSPVHLHLFDSAQPHHAHIHSYPLTLPPPQSPTP